MADIGCEVLTDSELCNLVSVPPVDEEDEDDQEEQPCPSKAAEMFEQSLAWLEQQPEDNTSLLRELHSLASQKRVNSMVQSSITDFM